LELTGTILQTHVYDIHLTAGINEKVKKRVQNSYQLQDIIYEEDVPNYDITNATHNTILSTEK
jgi:hypothetical protein